ncbi:MAG: hypothetical protein B7Z15_20915, partial [Rhizobiales bacterium 32-66-8]
QSAAGTATTVDSASGSTLTFTGANRVVSNTSGAALTFGSGLTVDLTGTEKEWYADATSPIVVNGVITGAVGSYVTGTVTGGLIKSGDGVLELRGTNTYSGVTRLQGGAVLAVASAAFGTSKVVFEGGTLRYGAAITGGYASQFAPLNYGGMARLDTNGFNVTLDTALSGSSGLTKLGTGILTVAGTLNVAGTLSFDLWGVSSGSGSLANNDFLTFLTGSSFSLGSTGALSITAKAGAGDSATWASGTWFQLFDFGNVALGNRSVALDNTANWVLPALNSGLVEWDFSRLATEGRIYVVAKATTPTLEFDPVKSISGTVEWKDDTGYFAWDDTSVAGVSLQEWVMGANAVIKNGASNSLRVVENVSASSLFQSTAGTATTVDSVSGNTLTFTGANRVVSNTSGA